MSRMRKRQKLHPALPILEPSKKRVIDKKPLKVKSYSSKGKTVLKVSSRNKS